MLCLISDANFGTLILMITKQMFMIFVGGREFEYLLLNFI
jgi:hypothetical protein